MFSRAQDPESSSPSERTERKPAALRGKRHRRNPELDESQYETEYTTGGETGNELEPSHWFRSHTHTLTGFKVLRGWFNGTFLSLRAPATQKTYIFLFALGKTVLISDLIYTTLNSSY